MSGNDRSQDTPGRVRRDAEARGCGFWRRSVVAMCRDSYPLTADSSAFVRNYSELTCLANDQFLPGYVVVAAHANGNHQAGGGGGCGDGGDSSRNLMYVCEKARRRAPTAMSQGPKLWEAATIVSPAAWTIMPATMKHLRPHRSEAAPVKSCPAPPDHGVDGGQDPYLVQV